MEREDFTKDLLELEIKSANQKRMLRLNKQILNQVEEVEKSGGGASLACLAPIVIVRSALVVHTSTTDQISHASRSLVSRLAHRVGSSDNHNRWSCTGRAVGGSGDSNSNRGA